MTRTATGTSRVWRARDLLAGLLHAVVATAASLLVYLWLRHLGTALEGGGAQLLRATGITALVWSYAGLLLGLTIAVRAPRPILARRTILTTLHRQLNLAASALALAHLVSFAALSPGGSWLVALVPQTAGFGRLAYSAGVLAFYLAVVLGPSYYLRDRIGRRTWLVAHQFAAVSYALAAWHTLVLGSSFRIEGPARTVFWVLQLPLLALIAARLARPLRTADRLDATVRPARSTSRRNAVLRTAVWLGAVGAGFGVLYVVLAALEPGLRT